MSVIHKTNVEEAISNNPNAATAFDLAPSATLASGIRNVLAAYADTEQLPYFANDGNGLWESGIGTVTSTTLVRTTILESSNAGSAVDFSAGSAITLHVEWPAKIADRVQNSGGLLVRNDGVTAQAFAPSTFTRCTTCLSLVDYDDNGWWDNTNKYFKPNIPGKYLIICGIQLSSMADGTSAISVVRVGTASPLSTDLVQMSRGYSGIANAALGVSGSVIVDMDGVNDLAEFWVYQKDTVPRNNVVGEKRVFFSAVRVGD